MLRKLLIPAACALLLGGCVTGYGYGDGGYRGGYYYGQPSVRYYGGVGYGSGYGYYPYSRYGYSYGYPYGTRYYGGYYGGYPYYGYPYYPYYPRRHHDDDHDDDDRHDDRDNDRKPPWRDWANRIHRDGSRPLSVPSRPQVARPGRTPSVSGPVAPRPVAPNPVAPRPAIRPSERAERREAFRARAMPQPRNRSERDARREQEP